VRRVIASAHYILGAEVERFERTWADFCGVRECVGTGNCMDALEIGLRGLGIGPGDEVITTPTTAFATTLAILKAGAIPVFADIDAQTALLDPASVVRCITPQTRAVLLVHLYGRIAPMDDWVRFSQDAKFHLVEDCAQAHGASWHGGKAGRFGAFGAFSFYPTKNLGAVGDAGALVTDDASLAAHARRLRNYGQAERFHHVEVGLNSRLDEIQAALLSGRLAWLQRFTERRQGVAYAYRNGINNPRVRLLGREPATEQHVHHLFVVTCEERDRLAEFLLHRGVQTAVHYPVPVHRQPPCSGFRTDPAGLVNAEKHAATCLSIPCNPQLRDEEIGQVIEAVNEFH
jgi:dTDP-4-amino-4,6-dideoxygalactose transaminase